MRKKIKTKDKTIKMIFYAFLLGLILIPLAAQASSYIRTDGTEVFENNLEVDGVLQIDGTLRLNNSPTNGHLLQTDGSGNISFIDPGTIASGSTNIVSDLSPQLGGDLDTNNNSIVSVSNANITIAADGNGDLDLESTDMEMDIGQKIYLEATPLSNIDIFKSGVGLGLNSTNDVFINMDSDASGTTNRIVLGVDGETNLARPILSITDTNLLEFEGSTNDTNETTFSITDATADRTLTFPDLTGEVQIASNGVGTSGQVLTSNGAGVAPSWQTAGGGSSLFTDAAGFSYLTDTAENLIIGGSTQAGSDIRLNADGSAVFNEQGAAVDFRVEGDTDTNTLFVDASENRVGIGTAAPGAPLHVQSPVGLSTQDAGLEIISEGNTVHWGHTGNSNFRHTIGSWPQSGAPYMMYFAQNALTSFNSGNGFTSSGQAASARPFGFLHNNGDDLEVVYMGTKAANTNFAPSYLMTWDGASGRVGVGNRNPASALDVAGTITTTDIDASGTVTANAFVGDGSGLTNLTVSAADPDWTDDGAFLYLTATTENVIIGTDTAPATNLHLFDSVTSGTSRVLTLETVDSGSPGANNIRTGMEFRMDNTASPANESIVYGAIDALSVNPADGSETGRIELSTMTEGSFGQVVSFDGTNGMTMTTPRMRSSTGVGLEIEGSTIGSATEITVLTLEMLDTGSPGNNNVGGKIDFEMDNNAAPTNEEIVYASIGSMATNVVDGSETGEINFRTTENGTAAERVTIDGSNGIGLVSGNARIYNKNGTTVEIASASAASSSTLRLEYDDTSSIGVGNDVRVDFATDDSTGTHDIFARLEMNTLDPATGSEDAELNFYTMTAGTFNERMSIDGVNGLGFANGNARIYNTAGTTVEIASANTTSSSTLRLEYDDTNSIGVGNTVGVDFATDDSTGAHDVFASMDMITNVVTAGSEDGRLEFSTMAAGTLTERMQIDGNGLTVSSGNIAVTGAGTFSGDGSGLTNLPSTSTSKWTDATSYMHPFDVTDQVMIGANTAPDTELHLFNTLNASSLVRLLTLENIDSSTPAPGIGTGMVFKMDNNASGANESISYAAIDAIANSVIDGSEAGRLEFYTMENGILSEQMQLEGTNGLNISSGVLTGGTGTSGSGIEIIRNSTNSGVVRPLTLQYIETNSNGNIAMVNGIALNMDDDANNIETIAAFDAQMIDPAAATTTGRISLKTITNNGTSPTETMRVDNTNGMNITAGILSGGSTAGSGVTVTRNTTNTGTIRPLTLQSIDTNSNGSTAMVNGMAIEMEDSANNIETVAAFDAQLIDVAEATTTGRISLKTINNNGSSPTETMRVDNVNGMNIAGAKITGGSAGASGITIERSTTDGTNELRALTLKRDHVSGNGQVGLETGLNFELEDDASTALTAGGIEVTMTDVTAASPDSRFNFYALTNSATDTQVASLDGTNGLDIQAGILTGGGGESSATGIEIRSSNNVGNSLIRALTLQRQDADTGRGQAGMGTGILMELENDTNTEIESAAAIDVIWQSVAATAENAELIFSKMTGGTLTEEMRIDESGNVGIGTTNPGSALDVNGGIRADLLTTDPCGGTDYPEGTMFYNNTSDYYCFCNGAGDDVQMHSPATACF